MSAGAQVAIVSGILALLSVAAILIARRIRGTPEKRERKRRLLVHREGRLGEAVITESSPDALYYSYSVRGVQYAASQDISTLRDRLPTEPERLIGHATLKYATNNPANSILLCEEWSGLRAQPDPASKQPGQKNAEPRI